MLPNNNGKKKLVEGRKNSIGNWWLTSKFTNDKNELINTYENPWLAVARWLSYQQPLHYFVGNCCLVNLWTLYNTISSKKKTFFKTTKWKCSIINRSTKHRTSFWRILHELCACDIESLCFYQEMKCIFYCLILLHWMYVFSKTYK